MPDWGRRGLAIAIAEYASYVGAVLLIGLVIRSLVVVITGQAGHFPLGFNPDSGCRPVSYSCGVISGIAMTFLSLSLASVVFLFWRLGHVQFPYMHRAEEDPRELVPTAGSIVGDVVGRDQLCHVIIDDLRDRHARRPHLIVGGVGVGKTAVLVQLAKLLAASGAVPVAVRLRDAQSRLRFNELARDRFQAEVEETLVSGAEGDKVWRRLSKDDRIVVLADGLEEALSEGEAKKDRDNLIRLAIREAARQRLPLVIATRPHDPLAGVDAAVIELEPLSEEAALEYIDPDPAPEDEPRLDWVVETADVVETPLYLRVARQLYEDELLDRAHPGEDDVGDGGRVDTRGVDRIELRLRLMRTWTNALIEGYFHTDLPLDRDAREAVVIQLSALACAGLMSDTLQVKFDDFPDPRAYEPEEEGTEATGTAKPARKPGFSALMPEVRDRLQNLDQLPIDVKLAAVRGAQLELVETRADGVRFPHSIMQAYLGSRVMEYALKDQAYLNEALKEPARELLAAVVMHAHGSLVAGTYKSRRALSNRLRVAARKRAFDAKRIDLLTAALEIDGVDVNPLHPEIAEELKECWPKVRAEDRTVENSKLIAVARFGEVARALSARRALVASTTSGGRPSGARDLPSPAYGPLLDIARCERSYPIRLAAAQQIGAGGDDAYDTLKDRLGPHVGEGRKKPRVWRTWVDGDEDHYELVVRAWLAPLLVGSTSKGRAAEAKRNLRSWLEFVGRRTAQAEDVLPVSLEVALAQGFKHAANRRRHHAQARAGARDFLQEQAREMLRRARFWYSRLTLIQALTLWELKEEPDDDSVRTARLAEAKAAVNHWRSMCAGYEEHPFVTEAAELAVQALVHGQPERFMWIDESGVVTRVGSRPTSRDARRKHHLWIPPSTGWTVLHSRALRLVADVLLLLNLAERGESPELREERMRRARRDDLPPCLSHSRSYLDPARTVGMVRTDPPGSNCKKGCPFELCPYPPKGEQTYRVELSEAFCRRQHYLLGIRADGRPPWYVPVRTTELRDFWDEMARRAKR